MMNVVLRAASFAARKHRFQRRKDEDASPYINHPIEVARVIDEIGNVDDPEILAAALLHDTIEDTDTEPAELEAEFGPRVCRIVQEVTDDKSMKKAERKRRQIVHASELSNDAVIVKLADKIANVQDITDYPPVNWELERRVEYLDWAKSVVSNCPVANQALLLRFHEVLNNAYEQLSSGTT
jgi:guanosine-3',5'-bis(diphosphate) 3'-pyrophosphohydrolase